MHSAFYRGVAALICFLATSCTEQKPQDLGVHLRLRPLTLCEMGRYSDYSGEFEIVAMKLTEPTGSGFKPKHQTTLRLIEPLIGDPENGRDFSTRPGSRESILGMRANQPGNEVVAFLALPEGVRTGSRVLAFIGHITGYGGWGDLGYQSVFVPENGKYWNLGLYPPENAVSLATLRAEALRGSKLPRESGPSCDPNSTQAIDAGYRSELPSDGGIP